MVELRLLGTLEVQGDPSRPASVRPIQPRRLALLAYLAASGQGGVHRRDAVLGVFWPEVDERRGRRALAQALYSLRQIVGTDAIIARGDEEILVSSDRVRTDVAEFDRAVRVRRWAEALALYRGQFAESLIVSGVPEFEHWLDGERMRRQRQAAEAAVAWADEAEARNDSAAAIRALRRALEISPFEEPLVARLVHLLDGAGDRAGALLTYASFEQRLGAELDARPAPETQAAAEAARSRSEARALPPVARPAAPAACLASDADGTGIAYSGGTSRISRWWLGPAVLMLGVASLFAVTRSAPVVRPALANPGIVVLGEFTTQGDGRLDSTAAALFSDAFANALGHVATVLAGQAGGDARKQVDSIGGRLAVWGSIRGDPTSPRITAYLYDARESGVRRIPVVVPASDSALALAAARLSRSIVPLIDPRFRIWATQGDSAPRIEAFAEYARGIEHDMNARRGAARSSFERAAALDPSFVRPRIWLALLGAQRFDAAQCDSAVAAVVEEVALLSREDAALLRYASGGCDGWLRREPVNWLRALEADPGPEYLYLVVTDLVRLNRARSALDRLEEAGLDDPWLTRWPLFHWTLAHIYHQLGRYGDELAATRLIADSTSLLLRTSATARALSALGRFDDLDSLAAHAIRLQDSPLVIGTLLEEIAGELLRHGHHEAARDHDTRLIDWYRGHATARPAAGRAFAMALTHARQTVEAEPWVRQWVNDQPSNPRAVGLLGVWAALAGDTTLAHRVIEELGMMTVRAAGDPLNPAYWRAAIHANLGEADAALRFLVEAAYRPAHTDRHFQPLWGDPRYEGWLLPPW